MWSFCLAVFLLISTPGPGVMSAAGIGAAYGARAGLAFVLGLALGQHIVIAMIVSGLAAAILAAPWIRTALLVLSTVYLLYLAARIAFAGAKIQFIAANRAPGVMSGLLLQPVNPKAYVVLGLLFTGFPIWPDHYWAEVAIKIVLLNTVWFPIHVAWVFAGVWLQRLNLPGATQRGINIVMALAMLAVVALAAYSGLR